jgi:glutamine phosphoribosylpyrophosphate amidotransferase
MYDYNEVMKPDTVKTNIHILSERSSRFHKHSFLFRHRSCIHVYVSRPDDVITSSRNIFITRIMHARRLLQGPAHSAGNVIGIPTRKPNETAHDLATLTRCPGARRMSGIARDGTWL